MCPRGRPRGQGRPRGLHLCQYVLQFGCLFLSLEFGEKNEILKSGVLIC